MRGRKSPRRKGRGGGAEARGRVQTVPWADLPDHIKKGLLEADRHFGTNRFVRRLSATDERKGAAE